MGKEIAHLTYARSFVADDAKDWQYGLIWADLVVVIREFLAAASAELLPTAAAIRILAATVTGLDSALALASAASATYNPTLLQNSPLDDPRRVLRS